MFWSYGLLRHQKIWMVETSKKMLENEHIKNKTFDLTHHCTTVQIQPSRFYFLGGNF